MEGTTEKSQTNDAQLTSAAAFVDGGIQDSCDDACSICLESFCESDPSTLTSCEHEFHLQCILEWSQRSSQCPMCWQPMCLKDPTSQELLEAIEKERSSRFNPSRNATIFHHPNLGDFEPQHLPVGVDNSELEERIIQHLAAAAAMRRARHTARREGHRTNRSSAQSHPQFLMFSSHSESSSPHTPMPSSPSQSGDGEPTSTITVGTPPSSTAFREEYPVNSNAHHVVFPASGFSVLSGNKHGTILNNRRSPSQSSLSAQNRAGTEPPVLQPFPESLKSRLNAVSMRYKESISRSTRSWKDKFFSRNTSMTDLGSEVRIEVNAGIATVSRMMESLEIKDSSSSPVMASVSPRLENQTPTGSNNQTRSEADAETSLNRAGVHGTSAAASGLC